jgi:lactate dehydrogenase-like 2-hydroxyacid dehydrogenase
MPLTVLEKLYLCGVRYIALRSVGSDNVDIKKASSGNQSGKRTRVLHYSVAEQLPYYWH